VTSAVTTTVITAATAATTAALTSPPIHLADPLKVRSQIPFGFVFPWELAGLAADFDASAALLVV
jgi:hypothetical protein